MVSRRKPATIKEDLKEIVRQDWSRPKNPYDEVFPGIFIGDATTALSVRTLVRENVTHVLNAAMACDSCLRKDYCGTCVLTKPSYYSLTSDIVYKGIQAVDERRFPLWRYFEESSRFIEDALAHGGKVFVHCQMGISRSSTLVLAYLMMKKNKTAIEAIQLVKSKRPIYPNDGFLEQLCDLELRLRSQRNYA